jgi:hypothetical protein
MASSFSGAATNFKVGSMRALHCTLSATTATISGATAADPCVLTATSHGLSDGDRIRITSVVGMTELNNRDFVVTATDANSLTLVGEDSTNHTAYSSAGTATLYTTTDLGYTDTGSTLTIEQEWRDRTGDQDGATKLDSVLVSEGVSASITLKEVTVANIDLLMPHAVATPAASSDRIEGGGNLAGSVTAYSSAFLFVLHPMDAADTSPSGEWRIYKAYCTGTGDIPMDHTGDTMLPVTIVGYPDTDRTRTQRTWGYHA